jgi:hypothetical protein
MWCMATAVGSAGSSVNSTVTFSGNWAMICLALPFTDALSIWSAPSFIFTAARSFTARPTWFTVEPSLPFVGAVFAFPNDDIDAGQAKQLESSSMSRLGPERFHPDLLLGVGVLHHQVDVT